MTCITVFSTILCYGFKMYTHRLPLSFPQCCAAERLRARGDAVGGSPAEAAAAATWAATARGVRRCGCRAGRMSAAARATGASTSGTFRATCARRIWRTCSTSTAASARSSSRIGTASCPSPSCASRTPGEGPALPTHHPPARQSA